MIDVINNEHIFSVQKKTALFCISGMLMAVCVNICTSVLNLTTFSSFLFNIVILAILTVLYLITFFVNSSVARISQIICFIIMGFLTISTSTSYLSAGFLFLLIAVLLSYIYCFIDSFSWKINAAIIVTITLGTAGGQLYLVLTKAVIPEVLFKTLIYLQLTAFLIFYILVLIKKEFYQMVSAAQKLHLFIRLGMNAVSFLHSFSLGVILNAFGFARHFLVKGDITKAIECIDDGINLAMRKEKEREMILKAIRENKKDTGVVIDIHENILSIIQIFQYNKDVFKHITLAVNFYSRTLFIKAVPYELCYIINNIIDNAADAILGRGLSDRPHKNTITVSTVLNNKEDVQIIISDNGPGFPGPDKNNRINIRKIVSSKQAPGGYGLFYILTFMEKNNGTLEVFNNHECGARFVLTFKSVHFNEEKEKIGNIDKKEKKENYVSKNIHAKTSHH